MSYGWDYLTNMMNGKITMMYSKTESADIWVLPVVTACLILLIGVRSGASVCPMQLSQPQYYPLVPEQQEPNALDASAEPEDPWLSIPVEKRKLKLMLGASIAIILGFFLVVLMTRLMRRGRQYRRRVLLRKTAKPTEHVDVWSNYRLKENWQDDLPDELQKPDPK
ncbi:MAG: hypothetical protein GY869_06320 [Planctomycetes bacterium]|nr:hypothetical protein [Planctomycetota bacterium]